MMAWPPEANEDIEAFKKCKQHGVKVRTCASPSGEITVCDECGWEIRVSDKLAKEKS